MKAVAKIATALGILFASPQAASRANAPAQAAPPGTWKARGILLEACSCSVPCPCNFGQGPSRDYCYTIYAYRLKSATYNGVKLDGLLFGGGQGQKGDLGFLDSRATPAQKPVLEKLALAVFAKGGATPGPRRFVTARLAAEDNARHFSLDFKGTGGFAADILLGGDRAHPIIVENNTTWPVRRFIKGKTTTFDYADALGNRLRYEGVNANLGEFDLAGTEKDL